MSRSLFVQLLFLCFTAPPQGARSSWKLICHVTYISCLLLLVKESLHNPDTAQAELQRCHTRSGLLNNRITSKQIVFLLHLHRLATLDGANSIAKQKQVVQNSWVACMTVIALKINYFVKVKRNIYKTILMTVTWPQNVHLH